VPECQRTDAEGYLGVRQGGRHPPPAAGSSGSGRRGPRPISPQPLRPGARHDLAAAASEGVRGLSPSPIATTPYLPLTLPLTLTLSLSRPVLHCRL